MASAFRIAVTRADGYAVELMPGGIGERDLVQAITQAAVAKGVGMFRTEAHVKAAIESAITDVLRDLKREVIPLG